MQEAVKIVHTVDEICYEQNINVDEMTVPCTIKADLAYDLCSAITYMYEMLLKHELITTGNKANQYTLH